MTNFRKKSLFFVICLIGILCLGIKVSYAYYLDTIDYTMFNGTVGDFFYSSLETDSSILIYAQDDNISTNYNRVDNIPDSPYSFISSKTTCEEVSTGNTITCTLNGTSSTGCNYTYSSNNFSINTDTPVKCKFYFDKYREVKYIESSGTQYIDTGIKPDDTIVMQIKFNNLEVTDYNIIGYFNGTESDSFRFFNASSTTYLDYGSGSELNRIYDENIYINTIYELEIGNRYVKNLETNTNILSSSTVTFDEKNYTICINGNSNYSKNRWYYIKIYKNGTLVRDFVPSIRSIDSEIGLYDSISKTFFTNNGTGKFGYETLEGNYTNPT